MLARNARMFPHDTALVERSPQEDKRISITWQEFDKRANMFARVLQEMGVKKGDRVMQLMHNSLEWLVVYFGIVRSGAWVVPLNFRFTAADIQYCTHVAEPRVFVFGEEFGERLSGIRETLPGVEKYSA